MTAKTGSGETENSMVNDAKNVKDMIAESECSNHNRMIAPQIRPMFGQERETFGPDSFRMHSNWALSTLAVVVLAIAALPVPAAFAGNGNEHWVATWSTALHEPNLGPPGLANSGFSNQTLREIVHTSVGGDRVRVRLSTFGARALLIGAAHIALRDVGAAIVPGSDRPLTFSGQLSVTIPPGAVVLSDPVDLDVPALGDLVVSIFVPGSTGPATWHFVALQTSYISPPGDFTASAVMPVDSTTLAWR
jgi:hypothetical protein